MKKVSGFVAALVVVFLFVAPSMAANSKVSVPRDTSGFRFDNPAWVGLHVARSTPTTTPQLLRAGETLVFAICKASASADAYAVAYDSNSLLGLEQAEESADLVAKQGSPRVYGRSDLTPNGNSTDTDACWYPPVPARFEQGVVVKENDAGSWSLIYYRDPKSRSPLP